MTLFDLLFRAWLSVLLIGLLCMLCSIIAHEWNEWRDEHRRNKETKLWIESLRK